MLCSKDIRVSIVAVCIALGAGCSSPPRTIAFETATVSASNIVPNCEGVTQQGEFSTFINAKLDGSLSELVTVSRMGLADGDSMTIPAPVTLDGSVGDELCLVSSGTEEHDTLVNDDLNEAEHCQEIIESTTSLTFELRMTNVSTDPASPCVLAVTTTATITDPDASTPAQP